MIGAIKEERLELIFPTIEHESSVQYRLMEVADARIAEAIESGKNLYIRGGPEDDAVICTDKETFRLRELVTSNMFLVAEKDLHKEVALVVGKPTTTIEVAFLARAPGIDQLAAALKAHPYNGASAEEQAFAGVDGLHCTRLFHVIQASDAEINQFLTEQGALIIKDHFRVLGSSLLCRFFELFLNTFVLEDWSLSEPIGFNRIWAAFRQYEDEFPEELTRHIVNSHLTADGLIDSVKIARFFAQELLKARPHWDVEDFMDAWDRALMDVIKPDINQISDLHLKERHPGSGRMEMTKFFRSDLPSDPESRFVALFKARSRWQYEELIPFIADFGRDTKELDAVILKHGRFSTQKDIRFITPRSQLLE